MHATKGLCLKWGICTCKQGLQALFEQCQASMDPNSIAQLLAHHPYHIDALLAMFELYRFAPSQLSLKRSVSRG